MKKKSKTVSRYDLGIDEDMKVSAKKQRKGIADPQMYTDSDGNVIESRPSGGF